MLGGHLICLETKGYYPFHIKDARTAAAKHKSHLALKHFVCKCRDASTACGKWLGQSSDWGTPGICDRTAACLQNKLNIGFLRTCWSVYEDARLIPFSSNCFSFSHGAVFVRFVLLEIDMCRRKSLRELHFRSTLGYSGDIWETALVPKVLSQLSGLRRINITMARFEHRLSLFQGSSAWQQDRWVRGFLNLHRLPLSDAAVTLWKPVWYPHHELARFEELATDDVRAYTRRLEERILAQPGINTA